CVAAVHLAPQLVVLVAGATLAGWRPDLVGVGALLVALLLVFLLALGAGLLLAALNVLFRDVENLVDLVLMVLVWASPVLYSWQRVRDLLGTDSWLLALYQANPLTVAVELMHRATWAGAPSADEQALPPGLWGSTSVALLVAVVLVIVGQWAFRTLSGRFAQEL
ncbi:MAG TPA: ABC transporter permease, partial [Intrasporangium sp.]|nr:ABC transporter permease [Intrasporangium sp.]